LSVLVEIRVCREMSLRHDSVIVDQVESSVSRVDKQTDGMLVE
jgi:hypothetical protein